MIHNMKTIKLFFLLLSVVAGLASLTSCGDNEPEPMPVAKAPVFVMNENFTITATCPNSYKAFIDDVEKTLPYTVTQTYQQQIIVVKGYGLIPLNRLSQFQRWRCPKPKLQFLQ